ncbi:DUF2155 domain-containing protein [Komagataeibacter sp. FNDCR2]|uniref:DUF2155 domain-containing protein n=1 Tax=Komagataeibacter sp. FNDCR2 TaxID=2878682 RepID=UPI001E47D538|nr:DUF2155 domain-containing protein [Komagataeibacter sp. FNDCR2]MCE2576077.1 DUF2155 domain-containing protein [Komagataeibacter sp. FNDCR2]
MKRAARCLPALLLACLPACAHATEWLAAPAIYPPDTWQGRSVAQIRVLDKLDAHVQMLSVPVGQDVTYKSLTLHATSCLQRPPTLPADAASWLDVRDAHAGMAGFQGWMAVAEPATGIFQNPLYDVQLTGCSGDNVAPVPLPLAVVAAQPPAPTGNGTATPDVPPGTPAPGGSAAPAAADGASQPLSPMQAPLVAPPASSPPPATPAAPDGGGAAPLMLH